MNLRELVSLNRLRTMKERARNVSSRLDNPSHWELLKHEEWRTVVHRNNDLLERIAEEIAARAMDAA